MLSDLAETIPSLVVSAVFVWSLVWLLRGDPAVGRRNRGGRREGTGLGGEEQQQPADGVADHEHEQR